MLYTYLIHYMQKDEEIGTASRESNVRYYVGEFLEYKGNHYEIHSVYHREDGTIELYAYQ